MKTSLALLAAVLSLAAPLSAQAHRAWLAPTSTVLSGTEAWVGFDAGLSNGVFIADHAAMRLNGLVITAPDGTTVAAQNLGQARYRSSFDLHLTQGGTYRVANVMGGIMATYRLDGEEKRWRGTMADFPSALPAGATDVQPTRTSSRVETFVTLNDTSTESLVAPAEGLALVPVTHPNDLARGEAATFRLVRDGQPAAGLEVTVARGGSRYRDNPEEQTLTTGTDGSFTITWSEAGLYWLNAVFRTPAQGDTMATSASYVAVLEVLP